MAAALAAKETVVAQSTPRSSGIGGPRLVKHVNAYTNSVGVLPIT